LLEALIEHGLKIVWVQLLGQHCSIANNKFLGKMCMAYVSIYGINEQHMSTCPDKMVSKKFDSVKPLVPFFLQIKMGTKCHE
jgi:hypothetical protein